MQRCRFRALLLLVSVLITTASHALAAETVALTVDATKNPEKLLGSYEVISVKPGPLTLYSPSGFLASTALRAPPAA
jgi:hypothetical protein